MIAPKSESLAALSPDQKHPDQTFMTYVNHNF